MLPASNAVMLHLQILGHSGLYLGTTNYKGFSIRKKHG
jgi:hypothetical protein